MSLKLPTKKRVWRYTQRQRYKAAVTKHEFWPAHERRRLQTVAQRFDESIQRF